MKIKTMPQKYRDQTWSILWFCWNREITSKFVYPLLYEGKLYSKWDAMPEECREMIRKSPSAGENRPFPVFNHHFKEGMTVEEA